MTARGQFALHCDHHGVDGTCTEQFGPTPWGPERTRIEARKYGWGGPALRDLCPAHSARRGHRTGNYTPGTP